MSSVVIVGSGVVGTATGKGFASLGHAVRFVDINRSRVDQLRNEGFAASTAVDLAGAPCHVILTLPTPSAAGRYDLSAFEAGVRSVGEALRHSGAYHTVVVRSTVPPGTCEKLVLPTLEQTSRRRAGESFALASNPEFLRAASAREDFLLPWMTVIGSASRRTVERLVGLYRPFGGEIRTFATTVEAELVKCAHNLFNATKISFWNEMWQISQHLGVPLDRVAGVVAQSAEGSINPEYGIRGGTAFGGACLPKDTRGFLGFAAELGVEMPVLSGVVQVNDALVAATNGHKETDPVEIQLLSA
ncbi:MAG: UDP-glucose/GDP-mannose dehydrogenase family protein [Acidimicrobiia bacterium]